MATRTTYMDMLAGYYNNSKPLDRVCRLLVAADSIRPAPVNRVLAPGHHRADCAGHSMDNHYMDHNTHHGMDHIRRMDRIRHRDHNRLRRKDHIHNRRRRSNRRRSEPDRRHRHRWQQWRHSACACYSHPSSCWRISAGTMPDRTMGRGSTCSQACPGMPHVGIYPAGRCA